MPINTTYAKTATLGDKCILYTSAQSLTEEQKAQARANIGAASDSSTGGKVYRHCVQVIASGTNKQTIFFFDFVDADSAQITVDTLLDRLDGKMMIVAGGSATSDNTVYKAVAFLVDSSRSSPYNVFSVLDVVTSAGVCYREPYNVGDVSQVNDYVQEMP